MFGDMASTLTKEHTGQRWAACREAVALGMTVKEAAEKYGLSYLAARKRAQREGWPTPSRIAEARHAVTPAPSARDALAASWAERGEAHRRTVMSIVERALGSANVAPPESWADLERAARIGDRAAGLEKAAPLVQLAFPSFQSGEVSPFYEASPDFADTPQHLTPLPPPL